MVFYFSATGNSLYIAKELDRNAISIPQALKGALDFKDESIGIVFPDYGSEMPYIVKEFLSKAHFDTPYFYLIPTYGCNKGECINLSLEECKKHGIKVSYIHSILMVDNFLPAFDMKEEMEIDKKIGFRLEIIKKDIKEKKHFIEETTEEEKAVYKGYLEMVNAHPELSWKRMEFTVLDSCIACNTCIKVCPVKAIKAENGKAKHTYLNCQRCLSCVNNCPKKAITISQGEKNPKERFRNQNVKLSEIIKANA